MDKFFAIGDIHGCFNKLFNLMDKIDIDHEKDTLVFLGDYIDRGPDSFEVIEYLIGLKKNFRKIIFLKGNHEEMLENYLKGPDKLTYLNNGGQNTLESYIKHNRHHGGSIIPLKHLDFFKSLLFYYQTEKYIFVHAGLKKKVKLESQKSDDMLWIRKGFINKNFDFGKRVVFGHTPFHEPFVDPYKIGIDTGAVYGNKLTCLVLPEISFYSS